MRNTLLSTIASLFILTAAPVNAGPLISIGSMYDMLPSDQQNLSKRIYNNGDNTAFVRVDVLEIDPKMTGKESAVQTLKDDALVKDRLLVTPMRLIIPPTSFQSVRMLWTGERSKERYFRVRFTPVMPQKNDGFDLDEDAITAYQKETINAGVNILAGYGTIMVVQPESPRFDTQITPKTRAVEITNKGNATVVIENLRQCNAKKAECSTASRTFILPAVNIPLIKTPIR